MAMTGGKATLVSSGTPSGWPGPISLYVYVKEKSQSIENNTTTLSLGMYVTTPSNWDIGAWTDWYGSYIGTANSGANCKTFDGGIPNFSGTRWLVENQDITVSHAADGKKTVTIYWKWGVHSGWSGIMNIPSGSFNVTLTTIPRTSSFTVSKASADMNTAVTFNISRASTSFTHSLLLTWGGKTSTISTGVATSHSWTIPLSLANDLPNSTSSGCIITCVTYNGSTEIGRATLNMTLAVPSSVKPTISNVTISEAASGLASKFGAYVQHKSKLKVVTTATGAYSSTIKTYATAILGKTYTGSTITSNVIGSSGSVSVSVSVVDSRGRTSSVAIPVTVSAYSDPSITKFTAQRCNSNGTLDENGECVKLSFALGITSLNSKNDKTYTIGYKLKEASEYTTLTSGSSYSLDTTYVSTAIFLGDNSYDFILTVTDYFKSVSQRADISTAFTLVDYHSSGTGMAIGKVNEKEDTFEVALDTEFNESVAFKDNTYAFQPDAFGGEKGYTLLAIVTLTALNVNAPIVFTINRRGALCPMTVYARFASSSTSLDPALDSITYEGDNFGAFFIKSATSTWKLYVDNTSGWSNPCLQSWYTTDNQRTRLNVTFADEQITTLPDPYYRATPAKLKSLLDFIYPVGSIYLSYSHVSPADLFGGTWTRIQNCFLWASSADATIGGSGGERTHVLTQEELPPHSHLVAVAGGSTNYGTTRTAIASFSKVTTGYQDSSTVLADGSGLEGAAHNNMPPYIQISAWRRTA